MEVSLNSLIKERDEIGLKIDKVEEFIKNSDHNKLYLESKDLIESQLCAMLDYFACLVMRIELFKSKEKENNGY